MLGSLKTIRSVYLVPAKRGGRVRTRDGEGTITSASTSFLWVRLDGETKPKAYHPVRDVVYLTEEAKEAQTDNCGVCEVCQRPAMSLVQDCQEVPTRGRWRQWVKRGDVHRYCDSHARCAARYYLDGTIERGLSSGQAAKGAS